ncbi:multidrug effflux MFS transporter [Acidisphaera sp. L21]|uniref:multidrug effflux MFS transporter n=1 Tax=Acidisphaera sp. L21 TaxID=1641851 RepID=UPI001C206877|nr:multidrug effflux MFS transporter [Acidisphaera sp. L21]
MLPETDTPLAAQRTAPVFLIPLLGALGVISPFSIDMYLPAFPGVAEAFSVATSEVAATLSSYFIGLAVGQVVYGPVLDRFGRKLPLCLGLLIYIAASAGCAMATGLPSLIAIRFLQALGGCGAQVASVAMVRDFFPVEDNARILSMLFLFIAVSPLLAPTVGGLVIAVAGWRAVFGVLAAIVAVIVVVTWFVLPEAHPPDRAISLRPGPILAEYGAILRDRGFAPYAFAGAFSFAGLFTYVAGAPIIFMEQFHLTPALFSLSFALLAGGFIGGSQANVLLLRRYDARVLFGRFLGVQVAAALLFLLGSLADWYGLYSTLALFFVVLACTGVTYPNAAAMAMAPFSRNAGSAAALLGFIQLGVGAVISSGIGLFTLHTSLPIVAILAATSVTALAIQTVGRTAA